MVKHLLGNTQQNNSTLEWKALTLQRVVGYKYNDGSLSQERHIINRDITSLIRRSRATFSLSHSSSLFSHIFFASSLKERGRIISEVNPSQAQTSYPVL